MRLWHQSFTTLDRLPGYKAALEEHFERVTSPGTSVTLHGMRPETYQTSYPGKDIRYAYFQYLHKHQIIEGAMDAEKQGYDAFLLASLPDPGFQAARSLVDIPVIGYGHATMHAASFLGSRFGIVCFIEELQPLYAANIRAYGLGSFAGPVRHSGLAFEDIASGFEDPTPVVDAFTRTVREMSSSGVDVVIPGEGPLSVILARAGVSRIDEVPIVDSLATMVAFAEAMARLRTVSGMSVTRRGYFYERPPSERVEELEAFYYREP